MTRDYFTMDDSNYYYTTKDVEIIAERAKSMHLQKRIEELEHNYKELFGRYEVVTKHTAKQEPVQENKKYVIVSTAYANELERQVNKYLEQGYHVAGGIHYANSSWVQAVVKYDDVW